MTPRSKIKGRDEEKINMKHSFVSKIIILLISIIFITIVIFSSITYFVLRQGITQQMKNDGAVLLNTLKRELENYDVNSFNEINTISVKQKKVLKAE